MRNRTPTRSTCARRSASRGRPRSGAAGAGNHSLLADDELERLNPRSGSQAGSSSSTASSSASASSRVRNVETGPAGLAVDERVEVGHGAIVAPCPFRAQTPVNPLTEGCWLRANPRSESPASGHFSPPAAIRLHGAGVAWGTGGPEFESRRPDRKNAPKGGVFSPSGTSVESTSILNRGVVRP